MSDTLGGSGAGGVPPRHLTARDTALRARKAAIRSRAFGIASTIVAVLILAGILMSGSGSGELEYVVFMIAALVVLLPLAVLGLAFGSFALFRARRVGTSRTTAIAGIALSGFGAVIGFGVRLWAETF